MLAYLGEGGGARSHEDLSYAVVEPLHGLAINPQETLSRPLLSHLSQVLLI